MPEVTVNADSIVRMIEIKKTKGGHASFNITPEMKNEMVKNGAGNEMYGNTYHPSLTGEVYIIMSTEKPEGWDDPSVEKVVKKKKNSKK